MVATVGLIRVRRVALILLWLAAVGLWAFVFFRSPASLPHLGPPPQQHSGSPPNSQSGPAGGDQANNPANRSNPGTGTRPGTGSQTHGTGPAAGGAPDAEDLAEGDVEDEPPAVTGVIGAVGTGVGTGTGAGGGAGGGSSTGSGGGSGSIVPVPSLPGGAPTVKASVPVVALPTPPVH